MVTDASGIEIAGAKIELQQVDRVALPKNYTLITNEEGETYATMDSGIYEVRVSKTGYAQKVSELAAKGQPIEVKYKLEVEAPVTEGVSASQVVVDSVRKQATAALLSIPGVVGVGSPGKAITVYVESLNPVEAELPSQINGIPVVAFKTGRIYAISVLEPLSPWLYPESGIMPKSAIQAERTTRARPVIGGVSIGHPEITAGTLGTSLRFLGLNMGISNNHVLANASTRQIPQASLGDPILQPGPYDGGTLNDKVGALRRFVPIDRVGLNRVDAAIYEPTVELAPDIYQSMPIRGVTTPQVGQIMSKSGRTTGTTQAPIIDVDATLTVTYEGFEATFEHQVVTNYQSNGGDSGSAGVINGLWGGLLFAGSDVVTVFNRPDWVIRELGLPNVITGTDGGGFNILPPLIAVGFTTWLALS